MRISIVRSLVFSRFGRELKPDRVYFWQDKGPQSFRMLPAPHSGTWQQAGIMRLAEEFTTPLPVIYPGIHNGMRAQAASFLSVDVADVVVSGVKQAQDGNDMIIWCDETAGRSTKASLDLGLMHRHWTGEFHPLEIKTLRVPLTAAGAIREVYALEQ
jgi:alpha-mannosidase